MRTSLKILVGALALIGAPGIVHAAEKPPVYTGIVSKLAVDGYDTVALLAGQSLRGKPEFTASYNGAEWRFATAENLAKFNADPAAYAPQFGGYCAWAVSQGYTAKGDPNFATVVDGKLYLNFNGEVRATWSKDIPGNISKGEANWPAVLGK